MTKDDRPPRPKDAELDKAIADLISAIAHRDTVSDERPARSEDGEEEPDDDDDR